MSYSLVSKVLNGRMGNTGVRPEVRDAILRKAEEMDYRPHPLATALKKGRKGAVGVLIHPMGERGSEFAGDLLRDLSAELDDHGLRMWLRFFESDDEFMRHFDMRTRHEVDALLVAGVPHPAIYEMLRALHHGGLPLVTVFERSSIEGVPNVTESMLSQGYLPTRHLLEKGARRLVHLIADSTNTRQPAAVGWLPPADIGAKPLSVIPGGLPREGFMHAEPRYEGFLAAHAEAGVPVDPRLVIACDDYKLATGRRVIGDLLDSGITFDGVVAQSDHQAVGAIHALLRRGKRVPEDVRVTGVDNSALCEACIVPITTVTAEMALVGRTAARLLAQALEGRKPESVIIEPRLVIRESS